MSKVSNKLQITEDFNKNPNKAKIRSTTKVKEKKPEKNRKNYPE